MLALAATVAAGLVVSETLVPSSRSTLSSLISFSYRLVAMSGLLWSS